uniref:CCHC-type domain-containing protein n=1 Tax=viral metagenome TaxID=1070528 RepID=A0A6C0K0C8_9ZZZZ
MHSSGVCSICGDSEHISMNCPELSREVSEPQPPQPTGPRGQGDDDE